VVLWHGTELAFREAFSSNGEGAIEAGASVFPRDCGREFDELGFGEILAKRCVEVVGDVRRRNGHGYGKAQNRLFLIIEMRARCEL